MKNNLLIVFLLLLVNTSNKSVIILLDRENRKKVIPGLRKLSEPTPQDDCSIKPDLSKLNISKPLIAVVHTSCLQKKINLQTYYSFETNNDIEELIKKLEKSIIKSIFWYYYDQ